jgi:hypothetical protein
MVCAVKAVPMWKILDQIREGERVALITCNTCVRSQDAGGATKMLELADQLRQKAQVTDEVVVTLGCFEDQLSSSHWSGEAQKIILLACEAGWSVVRRFVGDVPIILGATTLGVPFGTKTKAVKTIGGSGQ